MGCDIHSIAERFVDGAWRPITLEEARAAGLKEDPRRLQYMATAADRADPDWTLTQAADLEPACWEPFDDRNYFFFDWLCGVRGPRDELKSRLRDEPRDMPEDASAGAKAVSDGWGADGHSHSWATLAEFREALVGGHTIHKEGKVPFQFWAAWVVQGRPKETDAFAGRWPPGAYWHDEGFTEAQAMAALAPITPDNAKAFLSAAALYRDARGVQPAVGPVEYLEPMKDTFEELSEAMAVMEKIDPDPTKTRVIYLFDN